MSDYFKMGLFGVILFAGTIGTLGFVSHKPVEEKPLPKLEAPPEWKPINIKPMVPAEKAPAPAPQPVVPTTPYDQALAQAKATNKKVVLFFSMEGCVWCEKMKQEVLVDSSVKNMLGQYVFVELKDSPIAQKYNVQSYPTCVMIDSQEKVVSQLFGYKSANEFLNWLGGQQKRQPFIINRPKANPSQPPAPRRSPGGC